MALCPGPLAREFDKFRALLGRQGRQEREGRRYELAPKDTPLFRGLIEELHYFGLVRVGFSEFGPGISDYWLDRFVHRAHLRAQSASVLVKGLFLPRI